MAWVSLVKSTSPEVWSVASDGWVVFMMLYPSGA
jgi:hypothetical protein